MPPPLLANVLLLRRFSTVVDLRHLQTPAISISDLPSSKSSFLSNYTVSPPVSPWPRRPSPKRISALISAASSPDLALRIFDHASHFTPGFSHNYASYLALVDCLLRYRRLDPIPSLLSHLRSSLLPCGEQLFINLINAYSLASKPNLSLKIFLNIPTFGVKTSVRAFNALLNAMIRSKRYDLVPVLFRNCAKRFAISPNVFTCNILIKALCEVGNIEDALKVIDEMPEWGMVPNVVTYTTVIAFYCTTGDMCGARSMFDEVVGKELYPDVRTYTVFIDGFCKSGRLMDAIKVMDEMVENNVSPNEATYSVIIRACCKEKKSGEALNLIQDMLGAKIVPCSSLCCNVIDALCEDGKVDDACEIWKKLLKKNVTPDNSISSTLIYWLCKNRKALDAKKLFAEFEKGFIPSVLTYNTIISGLCENGELQEAARLWDDMVERKCYPNAFTYNVLIKGFVKFGDVKEGVRVFEEMIGKGCAPNKNTYGVLVDGIFECGDEEEGARVLGQLALRGGEFLDEESWGVLVRKVVRDSSRWREVLGEVIDL